MNASKLNLAHKVNLALPVTQSMYEARFKREILSILSPNPSPARLTTLVPESDQIFIRLMPVVDQGIIFDLQTRMNFIIKIRSSTAVNAN